MKLPPQLSSEDKAAFGQAERERSQRAGGDSAAVLPTRAAMGSQVDGGQQLAPTPAPTGGQVTSSSPWRSPLLLAVGAATTWRIYHRRPRPEPTT